MRKKLLKVKRVGVLAVILALFLAVGVAEVDLEALEEVLEKARTDVSGQWLYVVNTKKQT